MNILNNIEIAINDTENVDKNCIQKGCKKTKKAIDKFDQKSNKTMQKFDKKDRKPIQRASKDDPKYIILLKLLNTILVNINKLQITEITDFVDICRYDIIKPINKTSLEAMEHEIFPIYNKKNCSYYRKNANGFVLNCLRGMIKEINYEISFKSKDIYVNIDGTNFRKTDTIYTIK